MDHLAGIVRVDLSQRARDHQHHADGPVARQAAPIGRLARVIVTGLFHVASMLHGHAGT